MRTISVGLDSRERLLSEVMINSKLSFFRSLKSFRTKTKLLSEFETSKVYLSKKCMKFYYIWITHTLLHWLRHSAKAVTIFIYISGGGGYDFWSGHYTKFLWFFSVHSGRCQGSNSQSYHDCFLPLLVELFLNHPT
jgi:hypothetical protein